VDQALDMHVLTGRDQIPGAMHIDALEHLIGQRQVEGRGAVHHGVRA